MIRQCSICGKVRKYLVGSKDFVWTEPDEDLKLILRDINLTTKIFCPEHEVGDSAEP